jgi:2-keto-4-pentenoate hydratase/2-oxohepta-3-ene-1,7-dioic acid hydratase in catechol pathway
MSKLMPLAWGASSVEPANWLPYAAPTADIALIDFIKKLQGADMKLAFFDNYKLGVVVGDKIVDASAVTKGIKALGPQDVIRGVIEKWSSYKGKLAAAAKKGKGKPLAKVKLRPPLPKPENIICMAVNYMEDGTLPEPAPINAFMKSPSAVIGDGDTMVLPDMAASVFEGEAEIAVVIGKRASKVKAADAMKYVFGYTNFIDGSARGVVPPTNVFYQMKSRDTFAPIGPYIVTADEIKDPHKLQVKLTNNGTVYQNFNTDDMAHKIPRCIEWVTSIHTLEPGDILATGTNHRGLNPFMNGDKIELTCEGCGTLHISVRDDQKRTWARITRLQHKQSGAEGVHTKQTGGKYAK